MIRPFTLISALLFVLSGAYLFAVKHRAQTLDGEIAATTQATRQDEQRILVLQAQWALEVDPSRLAQLATQFTQLQPMQPSQLTTLSALADALPAPGSAVPQQNPAGAVPVMTAAVTPAPSASASASAPAATAVAADVPAAASALPARAVRAAAPERLASVEALLRRLPSGRHAGHRHEPVVRAYAENRPSYMPQTGSALAAQVADTYVPPPAYAPTPQAAYAPAPQPPMGAQVMSVRAVAPAPMPEDGGSMLGMAQNPGASGPGN